MTAQKCIYDLLLAMCILFCASHFASASADENSVAKYLAPKPVLVGEARMNYLWWNVYDIQLFAETDTWSQSRPYALKLSYLMELRGKAIAKRSIAEIKGLGFHDKSTLARWLTLLEGALPDVVKGDSLVGVYTKEKTTLFFKNDQFLVEIKEPEFGKYFFGIWLNENTSEPALREKLLNIQRSAQ